MLKIFYENIYSIFENAQIFLSYVYTLRLIGPISYPGECDLMVLPRKYGVYISGVRSSDHRVKPNMAANGAQSYVKTWKTPTLSFMFTCHVKTAQGDWNRRNSGPPCPPCKFGLHFLPGRWPEDLICRLKRSEFDCGRTVSHIVVKSLYDWIEEN